MRWTASRWAKGYARAPSGTPRPGLSLLSDSPRLPLPAPCSHRPTSCPAVLPDHGGGGRISRPRAPSRRELAMTPLRRRMTEDLILHNRSPKTIRLYINWVADFARYFHTSPDQLGPEHVRSYLLHLVQERQASWNVYKQARLALKFFYSVTLGREWVVAEVARPKGAQDTPGRPQPGRDGPVSRRATEPQAPRVAHDRLRRRVATLRGRPAPRRGHRQRPHGDPHPPGQGTQGPRRDALAAAADGPP